MDWVVFGTAVAIFVARITDVTVGTIRTVMVVNGYRLAAWALGFVEVIIWVLAVSRVITQLDTPAYVIAFALGAATGNFIGITIEQRLALGEQIVRVFSRKGREIAGVLRDSGHRVTEIDGRGRTGPVELLFVKTKRRDAKHIAREARRIDPECFYIVDDVRMSSAAGALTGGWRSLFKKK